MAIKEVIVDKNEPQPNKVLDILGYWIFLIPLFTMKNDFDRFHANQATVLFICSLALNIVRTVLVFIPGVGGILSMVLGIANLGVLALMIIGMLNCNKLECKPLPVIGELFQVIKY